MIKPGTLCYILRAGRPECIGRIVLVTGPADCHLVETFDGKKFSPTGFVSISADWLPCSRNGHGWVARIVDLRPIHGPTAEQSIRETDTVRDHDEITRRMA